MISSLAVISISYLSFSHYSHHHHRQRQDSLSHSICHSVNYPSHPPSHPTPNERDTERDRGQLQGAKVQESHTPEEYRVRFLRSTRGVTVAGQEAERPPLLSQLLLSWSVCVSRLWLLWLPRSLVRSLALSLSRCLCVPAGGEPSRSFRVLCKSRVCERETTTESRVVVGLVGLDSRLLGRSISHSITLQILLHDG